MGDEQRDMGVRAVGTDNEGGRRGNTIREGELVLLAGRAGREKPVTKMDGTRKDGLEQALAEVGLVDLRTDVLNAAQSVTFLCSPPRLTVRLVNAVADPRPVGIGARNLLERLLKAVLGQGAQSTLSHKISRDQGWLDGHLSCRFRVRTVSRMAQG